MYLNVTIKSTGNAEGKPYNTTINQLIDDDAKLRYRPSGLIIVLPSSIISFFVIIVVVTLGGLIVLGEEVHERVLALSLRRELAVEAAKEVGVAVHGRVKVGNESRDLKMYKFKFYGLWL